MGLACEPHLVETETDDVIGNKSARRPKAIDTLHENTHEEKASKPAREDTKEPLELVVDIADVRIRKP